MIALLVGILAALVTTYAALVVSLAAYAHRHPDIVSMRDVVRLLPDVLRLTRRLLADRAVSRVVRMEAALAFLYLAMPLDLVPDVVPVLGYADDAIVIALVLRSVVRRAGVDAVRRHWPGSAAGLVLVLRLAGVARTSDV